MGKFKIFWVLGLTFAMLGQAVADENDIVRLNAKVGQKVQKIEEMGILPTSQEVETITGDIVDAEVETTGTTVEQATLKYGLTPTLIRYIKLKEAGRNEPQNLSAGQVIFPEPP
jgi:hypothetical protein